MTDAQKGRLMFALVIILMFAILMLGCGTLGASCSSQIPGCEATSAVIATAMNK